MSEHYMMSVKIMKYLVYLLIISNEKLDCTPTVAVYSKGHNRQHNQCMLQCLQFNLEIQVLTSVVCIGCSNGFQVYFP